MPVAIGIAYFKIANEQYGRRIRNEAPKSVAFAFPASPTIHAYRTGGKELVLFLQSIESGVMAE